MDKYRVNTNVNEDVTAQAGWMFADLLLALAVIFLATISFVPAKSLITSAVADAAAQSDSVLLNENSIPLVAFDQMTIMLAMQKYAEEKKLPADYKVVTVTITGGYNSATETADRGTMTALRYAAGIASFNLPYFKNTSTVLAASSSIPSGQAILNVTIASKK
jgi:hypothetical protein